MTCLNKFSPLLATINARLDECLAPDESPLSQAARYALSSGKRLRPLLTLVTAGAYNVPCEHALDVACALEFLHTYSLIHDDLPCMDNDDYRRGRLTLHRAMDEATAVLTGDFLLTRSFELLAECRHACSEQKIAMMKLLARRSGLQGMIGGQMRDIHPPSFKPNIQELETTHLLKSGALLSCAIECGAVLGKAGACDMQALRDFGHTVGLAFQIIDDVLDVQSEEKRRGKDNGSDKSNNKQTYVTLLGVEKAKIRADKLLSEALDMLEEVSVPCKELQEMAYLLVKRSL